MTNRHSIIRDPVHGFFRVDPIPSANEVRDYYANEFYGRKGDHTNNSSLANMVEEAEFHRRAYDDQFAFLESHCLANRLGGQLRVADVGCGYGYWLKYLGEKGVEGFGVEPVAEGVEHCRSMGIAAQTMQIEELDEPPDGRRVDLVTMLNVLEHLREPARALAGFAANWLVERGWLLLRVPNDFNAFQLASDEVHKLGRWWVAPPRHINYFSAESLSRLVEACGFETVDVTGTFPLEIFNLMDEVYVGDPVRGKACHHRRVAFERNLETVGQTPLRRQLYKELAGLGLGREVLLLARRR
jgi:SAM-dependent methyltransferase